MGVIGPIPIGVNGSSSISQTYDAHGNETSINTQTSGSVSVVTAPLGIFVSKETTKNETGSTSTYRVTPINFGAAFGVGLVGEFNVSFGIKFETKKNADAGI